jgi:hypothetical protein
MPHSPPLESFPRFYRKILSEILVGNSVGNSVGNLRRKILSEYIVFSGKNFCGKNFCGKKFPPAALI